VSPEFAGIRGLEEEEILDEEEDDTPPPTSDDVKRGKKGRIQLSFILFIMFLAAVALAVVVYGRFGLF
jgi:hypothetical protein